MSGWAGSGRPPEGAEAEAALRDSLTAAIARWRSWLGPPQSPSLQHAGSIREEVRSLRAVVTSWGWTPLAQRLQRVERASEQSALALRAELETLAAWIPFGPGSQPPVAAHPPAPAAWGPAGGMTIPMDRPPLAPAGGARESDSLHRLQRTAVIAPPAASSKGTDPPKPVAKKLLGLRGFRREALEETPPPQRKSGSILNLPALSSQRPPSAPVASWLAHRTNRKGESGAHSRPSTRPPGRSTRRTVVWFYVPGGVIVAAALGVLVWAVMPVGPLPQLNPDAGPERPYDAAPPVDASPIAQLTALIHQIGEESDELRALVDIQGQLVDRCRQDSTKCDHRWTRNSIEAFSPIDAGLLGAGRTNGLIPLAGIKLPRDFPFNNDPAVTGVYTYHSTNIEGRQVFASMLRECSQYAEIFDGTLRKYGAPLWIAAVVYEESGCMSRVTSPVGAVGLWQFMPESARAYNLRIVEDELDERLNPVKETDAAIRMLADLERKFGTWDLALAAYNMGPYGLTERLAQEWNEGAGDGAKAGFWDLVARERLPRETAGYVPRIEAYALLLENRTRLAFPPDGKPLESTAEVVVASGTRLSLIARAAHTSTREIRELNPEFLRDSVPAGERSARVPVSEAHRAQSFLDDPPVDGHDACVPEGFDWGHQVFEKSQYAKTCYRDR